MATNKKRKSDVNIDSCANANSEHPFVKKEKPWFEEQSDPLRNQAMADSTNKRKSFIGGVIKMFKSSSNLKDAKHASTSRLEPACNETQISLNSESSLTSVESNNTSNLPNIGKNLGLRTFVNRDSFTPVPPVDQTIPQDIELPIAGSIKHDFNSKPDDSISISSHMSVDTMATDEDAMSTNSVNIFCTPTRHSGLSRNSNNRISTRSVPDPRLRRFDDYDDNDQEMPTVLYRSLCNSAVRRAPSTKSDGGLAHNVLRRSLRTKFSKRFMNSTNMEDVPEEEALTNTSQRIFPFVNNEEEEKFVDGRTFFDNNVNTSTENISGLGEEDKRTSGFMQKVLNNSQDATKKTPGSGSIGRNNSIFRKMFPGKNGKERRHSEVGDVSEYGKMDRRRSSIVSLSNDHSFATCASASSSILDGTQKPKMRKKTPSTSNLTQRLSSVFRRSSTSTFKDEDLSGLVPEGGNRRNTLTGYSSTSSGIGSIASGTSEQSFGTMGRGGASVSRNSSRRDEHVKIEKAKRLLNHVIVSDFPADELLKMKIEQTKKKELKAYEEKFETQLNESGSSTSSTISELLSFDVVVVDVNADGSPYSSTAKVFVDDELQQKIQYEIRNSYRPDVCGTIVECDPDLIFVCPETNSRLQNLSVVSKDNPLHLVNARNGLSKSIELWKSAAGSRDSSTLLIYPMFCQSEAEWDRKDTIDDIFKMLDALVNTKRWVKNGKCILAGLTANNVKLLKERYNQLKLFVAETKEDQNEQDSISLESTSTVLHTLV